MLKYQYSETGMLVGMITLPVIMGVVWLVQAYKRGVFHMPITHWIPKLNQIINGIRGAFIGVFIGHGIFVFWEYKTRPELYAMQSAPWYTSILVYGAFTIVVLAVCMIIKVILKYLARKSDRNERVVKKR